MPKKNATRRASVREEDLAWHLQNRKKTAYSDATIISDSLTIELAEPVAAGDAVAVGATGGVKAGTLPAIGIARTAGTTGDIIEIETREYTRADYAFTAGSIVWLSTDAVNMSTTPPALTAGRIVQKIGYAASSTRVIINMEAGTKIY